MGVGIETGDIHWTSQGHGTGACKQSDCRVAGKVRIDCQMAIIILEGALPSQEKEQCSNHFVSFFLPIGTRITSIGRMLLFSY